MNALKHMELIFGVVVVAVCIAAALPANPGSPGAPAQPRAVRADMPVVVIKGKRMSALEKRELSGAGATVRPDGANGS